MARLKEHRRRVVLSTRELAARADVSPATIWRIERGDATHTRPATVRAIARVLNVPPSSIDEFAKVIENNGKRADVQPEEPLDLVALAARQGVGPVADPGQLAGDFWPEEERIEDFVATIYKWRQEEDATGDRGKP